MKTQQVFCCLAIHRLEIFLLNRHNIIVVDYSEALKILNGIPSTDP